ncbi:MAG TPA: flagellar hook-basal body complex protein FliE [Pusillimonas sp.]
MAIQHLSAIESMLSQMRAVAQAASSTPSASAKSVTGANGGGFASELARSLERVSTLQNDSASQARAFQMGAPDISLNDVMIDMQKAGIAFQATVQVRNRLVAAYQEIASMPV